MKKILSIVLVLVLVLTGCQQENTNEVSTSTEIEKPTQESTTTTQASQEAVQESTERGKITITSLEDIDGAIGLMTLEEKAGQLIQAERGGIQLSEISAYNIGSILSGGGSLPSKNTPEGWTTMINRMLKVSGNSSSGIPVIYGIDAVHGNNNVEDVIIFPHNIGLGAANDPNLMAEIGRVTAEEVLATGIDWDFAPAVSCVQDIRWGRSYESYSEDINRVVALAPPYIMSLQENGVMATTKHFIGDGMTTFGTGEGSNLIDRGDVTVDMATLLENNLPAYEAAIAAGTQSIMASFNSVAGVKMHGNQDLLTGLLRDQLGFEGLVVSDWEAIHTIAPDLKQQVAKAINAGIDMLMQPYNWKDVYNAIIANVEDGSISEQRLDEAVKRVLVFKYEAGLFALDGEKVPGQVGTEENRLVAREAVAKSMVLLKNEGLLPLDPSQKIYLIGPASDNVGIQSGGWTRSWQGLDEPNLNNGTSLKDALEIVLTAGGGSLVDTPDKADVVILAIGEKPYTEMMGDTEDLSLDGPLALEGNLSAVLEAKESGKPVVTLMIAGRPMLLEDYLEDWESFVMAFLPGTEGLGMTDVLFGDVNFTGTMPVTWPKTNDQAADSMIMDGYETIDHQVKYGDGLTY